MLGLVHEERSTRRLAISRRSARRRSSSRPARIPADPSSFTSASRCARAVSRSSTARGSTRRRVS